MRRTSRPALRHAALLWVTLTWLYLWLALGLLANVQCMSDGEIDTLREEARGMFYHGLDNYYKHAYPEDELRPLTCQPLTRDRDNPAHTELNDVLGNYSLSLVDSLSTLAILASNPTSPNDRHNALRDFQEAVINLVADFGDGSDGPQGQGRRARGFDLDSKVQVFETTIRGVGGLLSAHLFATGDLPIVGYDAPARRPNGSTTEILWEAKGLWGKKFVYDGQLLRLATDLAQRILPSFTTSTGLPYPRVNLRHGSGFYKDHLNPPIPDPGQCPASDESIPPRERTETCSAGAGSLLLEFATLSHLTGNPVYQKLAQKAFYAVWNRRSDLDLVGSGIDAETGLWVTPVTGIGAGIDSFFEYAFKSHVLLSSRTDREGRNLSDSFLHVWQDAHSAIARHIRRGSQHQHPHYSQNDKETGGLRFSWIDSLSAFYPGLLAFAGEIEEAQESHLLYAALWTRYGALPERWNAATGEIEAGLRWWAGRPEFIESTWYLYRATQDPWYLRVGEMVLRDIKRRCYTPCGWAGLQDVATGEKTDRMESFFLGETVKYLYLLFDREHPLNKIDANFVFTTEGHPLILPRRNLHVTKANRTRTHRGNSEPGRPRQNSAPQCPVSPKASGLSQSVVASRADLFHAAVLSRLVSKSGVRVAARTNSQAATKSDDSDKDEIDGSVPRNHTFYPWTMPDNMVPDHGFSARMNTPLTFELTFPMAQNSPLEYGALQRVDGGILINSINGLRFGLILDSNHSGTSIAAYRIQSLSNLPLGRDENIWLGADVVNRLHPLDSQLSRVKDLDAADLYIDAPATSTSCMRHADDDQAVIPDRTATSALTSQLLTLLQRSATDGAGDGAGLRELVNKIIATIPSASSLDLDSLLSTGDLSQIQAELRRVSQDFIAQEHSPADVPPPLERHSIQAALCTGPGSATIPQDLETSQSRNLPNGVVSSRLPYRRVFVLDSELCRVSLPIAIAKRYQVLVIRRGGCRFDDKLLQIPSFAPTLTSLKLVIVVSFPQHDTVRAGAACGNGDRSECNPNIEAHGAGAVDDPSPQVGTSSGQRENDKGDEEDVSALAVRPHLENVQRTPAGVKRRHPIPIVMIGGGRRSWDVLERAAIGSGREDEGRVVIVRDGDARVAKGQAEGGERGGSGAGSGRGGIGIRRRYWFESEGIRVANLLVY